MQSCDWGSGTAKRRILGASESSTGAGLRRIHHSGSGIFVESEGGVERQRLFVEYIPSRVTANTLFRITANTSFWNCREENHNLEQRPRTTQLNSDGLSCPGRCNEYIVQELAQSGHIVARNCPEEKEPGSERT